MPGAGSLRKGATVERVLEEAGQLSRLPGLEQLEQNTPPGRPARFMTREPLAIEHDTLEPALAGRDVDAARPDPGVSRLP